MALPITKYPRGLTSLVGLRDLGITPSALSDQLVGTLDVTQWFLLQDTEIIQSGPANITGVGSYFFGPGTVPPGEAWVVHQYQVTVDPVIPAGNSLHVRAAMLWTPTGIPVTIGARVSSTAGEYLLAMMNVPQQLILLPGARLGWFVEGMTGVGPIPATYTAIITRLRV